MFLRVPRLPAESSDTPPPARHPKRAFPVNRAKQLAALGYTAFVADIYGADVRPKNPKENAANAGKYKGDRPLFQSRLKAAYDQLIARKETDKSRVGAMGYCFGGKLIEGMKQRGVLVKHIAALHPLLANCLRLTVGTPEENTLMIDALKASL